MNENTGFSKGIKIIIGIIVALVVIAAGSVVFYMVGIGAASSTSTPEIIEVSSGDTATAVLAKMEKKGLVKSNIAAKLYVKFNKPTLKADSYRLNKNMSLETMFNIMKNATAKYVVTSKLTIPEGSTMPSVATKVAKILGTTKSAVLKQWGSQTYIQTLAQSYWFLDTKTLSNKNLLYPLEGYFYPETYYISTTKPTLDSITRMMLDMMNKKLTPYKTSISNMGYSTHQFLTLTSIVEREALYDKDMPKIAGVFINRLKKNMYLQSDITVNYALQRTGVSVTTKMLKTDSHYNTYKYKGLPVGPISTVQEKTIKAVIHYTKHDYYYFFAKKDGTVIYSKTYAQHALAVKENKWY